MKKIGLFAGVFDPIHLGHTHFISRSIQDRRLDKVYVLIEREPKYKTCIASYDDRKNMVILALEDIPQAEIYESRDSFFPITSSLPAIRKAQPGAELYLLLGDDVAERIHEWEDQDGLRGVELIVASRGEGGFEAELSSLKIRNELAESKDTAGLDPGVLAYCRKNGLYQS